MFGRHRHAWGDPETLYCPPASGLLEVSSPSEDAFLRLMLGFTTLVQRCTECGIARTDTVIGRIK
jgi:hypothetical protein